MENLLIITEEDYKEFKKALLTFEELNDELCKLAATADGFDSARAQCKADGVILTDFILAGYSMCFSEHINKAREIVGKIEGLLDGIV